MRPLDGITVIGFEQAIAGPFCTRQLADMGARVIKIERPGVGDFARAYDTRARGLSSYFVWCNRSKESLTLDVKHPEAHDILGELLRSADVLVQNLAPGATDRLGLSYKTLCQTYPKLIVCDISGYGASGPYRDRKAYDLLIQAESGFVSITGTREEPVKAGCSIADISAGMYAYTNILAALLNRAKTGSGCRIDVSILESMTEWMGHPLYYAMDDAPPPTREGAAHATIYPYGPFCTSDGRTIMLGLQNEREWISFCEKVLAQPEVATDPRFQSNPERVAARHALGAIINEVFSQLSAAEILARLDMARIANASMNTIADVWAHPQLRARKRWVEVETPAGRMPALVPPGGFEGYKPRMDPVPALGQHTDAILSELGYDAETIARWRSERAI